MNFLSSTSGRSGWALLYLAIAVSIGAGVSANAAEMKVNDETVVVEGVEGLRLAIRLAKVATENEEIEQSQQILQRVVAAAEFAALPAPERIAALFGLGQASNTLGDHREAIRAYRRILIDFPGLVRVRLELARSFFLLEEDKLAEHHFRLALAGDLPDAVQANIIRHLREIRQRRRWSFHFHATAVGDTNVNVAPSVRHVEMLGVPFELDDDARAKSGIGVAMELFGEYRHPIHDDLNLRVAKYLHHTHYSNSDFHDTVLGGHLGPEFAFDGGNLGDSTTSFLVQAYRRWLGLRSFNWSIGPAIEYTFQPSRRFRVATRLEQMYQFYDRREDLEGTYTNLTVRPGIAFSPTSFGFWLLGIAHDRTDNPVHRNWQYRLGFGYAKEFPRGFTAGLYPEYRYVRYEEESRLFAKRRRDHSFSIRTNLFNRRIEWFGFSPVLSYRYQNRNSNIELFEFEQHRLEFALTREL